MIYLSVNVRKRMSWRGNVFLEMRGFLAFSHYLLLAVNLHLHVALELCMIISRQPRHVSWDPIKRKI